MLGHAQMIDVMQRLSLTRIGAGYMMEIRQDHAQRAKQQLPEATAAVPCQGLAPVSRPSPTRTNLQAYECTARACTVASEATTKIKSDFERHRVSTVAHGIRIHSHPGIALDGIAYPFSGKQRATIAEI